MKPKFIYDLPGVLIGKYLVVGDLHIGIDEKLSEKGLNFPNLASMVARSIKAQFNASGASKLVVLGDIKESIGYPTKKEYFELQKLLYALRSIPMVIVKGNHDAHIQEIISRLGYSVDVKSILIEGDMAFLHGNALPASEALKCRYIFEAHGHTALMHNGIEEKAFVVAKPAKKEVRATLVLLPPINPLIAGNHITVSTKEHIPAFRSGLFDFYNAVIYTKTMKVKVKDIL